jgi:hypothetical protein
VLTHEGQRSRGVPLAAAWLSLGLGAVVAVTLDGGTWGAGAMGLAPVAGENVADSTLRVSLIGALTRWGDEALLNQALDRVASPPVVDADDAPDAPIDAQLKSEVVETAPQN